MTNVHLAQAPTVRRAYVVFVAQCLERLGVPAEELAVPAPHSVVPQKQLWELWESARTSTGQTGWGVRMADLLPLHPPGLMGETLAASATLIEALAAFTQAATLLTWSNITITIDSSQVFVELHTDHFEYVHPEHVEFSIALMVRWLWPSGERPPFEANLRHRAPSDLRAHQRALGPDLRYGSERYGLSLGTETALGPYSGRPGRSELRSTIASVASTRSRAGIVEQVALVVAEHLGDHPPVAIPTLDSVADRLGLHPKSLNRRLAAEGTSFRALLDSQRRVVALTLLERPLSIQQIAGRLGYADTTAFVRAFRRWTGMAPGTYRSRTRDVRS